MLKSKNTDRVQEVILPDFPDDDNTVTTVTKSRRVSFGTNFVKEFIVGSAVSGEFMAEYEQAFPSSDSSNADSSHSGADSGLLEQSMFAPQDGHKVHKPVPPVGQTEEPDFAEIRPKIPKFSSTVCFSADSPTADMEFTEGCLTLAKSILDKKNKEMTLIIQAKPKDEEKAKGEETKYFDGSQFEMSMTRCLKSKGNRKEERRFESEKTKIFQKYENEMSITRCNRIFDEDDDGSWDECKENRMPLDMIMRHLDKDHSDLENDLFNPEKTFSGNFLNSDPLDFSNDSEQLNLNESMDISTDFQSDVFKTRHFSQTPASPDDHIQKPTPHVSGDVVTSDGDELQMGPPPPDDGIDESANRMSLDVSLPCEKMQLLEDAPTADGGMNISTDQVPEVVLTPEKEQSVTVIEPASTDNNINRMTEEMTLNICEKYSSPVREPSEVNQRTADEMKVHNYDEDQKEHSVVNPQSNDDGVNKSADRMSLDGLVEVTMPEIVGATPEETTKSERMSLDGSNGQNEEELVVQLPPSEELVQLPPSELVQSPPSEGLVQRTPPEELVQLPPSEELVRLPPSDELVQRPPSEEVVQLPSLDQLVERPHSEEFVERPHSEEFVERPHSEVFVERPHSEEFVERPVSEAPQSPAIENECEINNSTKPAKQICSLELEEILKDPSLAGPPSTDNKTTESGLSEMEEEETDAEPNRPLADHKSRESTCMEEEQEEEETPDREPSLVDVKVIESLKEQSKEPGCVWCLKDLHHPQSKTQGWLSFDCMLLESSTGIRFGLKLSNEDSVVACSFVTNSEIHLKEEKHFRLPEYRLVVDFGFGVLKKYFDQGRMKVETIRHVPYFLDQMNSFIVKLNACLQQIYSILTQYPGSRLEGSRLSFRLYSFPVLFSCVLSIDLSNLFRLSKLSLSFENDFGSLDENKVGEIFEECLKRENSLCEFVVQSTKYIIDLERESGCVSKRGHIRLLPAELKL